jgi:hypothetical protein
MVMKAQRIWHREAGGEEPEEDEEVGTLEGLMKVLRLCEASERYWRTRSVEMQKFNEKYWPSYVHPSSCFQSVLVARLARSMNGEDGDIDKEDKDESDEEGELVTDVVSEELEEVIELSWRCYSQE